MTSGLGAKYLKLSPASWRPEGAGARRLVGVLHLTIRPELWSDSGTDSLKVFWRFALSCDTSLLAETGKCLLKEGNAFLEYSLQLGSPSVSPFRRASDRRDSCDFNGDI